MGGDADPYARLICRRMAHRAVELALVEAVDRPALVAAADSVQRAFRAASQASRRGDVQARQLSEGARVAELTRMLEDLGAVESRLVEDLSTPAPAAAPHAWRTPASARPTFGDVSTISRVPSAGVARRRRAADGSGDNAASSSRPAASQSATGPARRGATPRQGANAPESGAGGRGPAQSLARAQSNESEPTLDDFLRGLGLHARLARCRSAGITRPSDLLAATNDDLAAMGFALTQRGKLLRALGSVVQDPFLRQRAAERRRQAYRERPAWRGPAAGAQRVSGEAATATAAWRRDAARSVVAAREARSTRRANERAKPSTEAPPARSVDVTLAQGRRKARETDSRRQHSASPPSRRTSAPRSRPASSNGSAAPASARAAPRNGGGDRPWSASKTPRPHWVSACPSGGPLDGAARLRPSTARPAWRPSGPLASSGGPRTPGAAEKRTGRATEGPDSSRHAATSPAAAAAASADKAATRLRWDSPDPSRVRARASTLRRRLHELLAELGPSLQGDSAAVAALDRTRAVVMRAERAFCAGPPPQSPPPSAGDHTSVFARSAGSGHPARTKSPNASLRRVGGGFDHGESEATYTGNHLWREHLRQTVHRRNNGDPLHGSGDSDQGEKAPRDASTATLAAVGRPSVTTAPSRVPVGSYATSRDSQLAAAAAADAAATVA